MAEPGAKPQYDALVVGAGVGGMESALTLGDMGFKVLLVEKEPSVGGRMILLSKVFPTLDCASCISTPKMAAVNNHPNVRPLVYSEVDDITPRPEGGFLVHLTRKPTFVDFAKCTGCAMCEVACTVAVPDEFNYDLAARHAAHIAFPQAVPKKAVITRRGTSPCSFTCPAGVKPHGYISLVRAGQPDAAFRQHLEDAPLVGVLSRACYAPCEEQCSRSELEGTVPIRGIKRFMADRYYAGHPEPEYGPPSNASGKKVAIVGSGPAGLAASFFLARAGHAVTVFEADTEPGGIMRWGIPSYRLPKDVLARDLKNISALGVKIETRHRVDSVSALQQAGFDAVFVAAGDRGGRKLSVPGEGFAGVVDAMEFLHRINDGHPSDLTGKTVVVIGGGNVAIDSARSALRLGARSVKLFCLESRAEMPAHPWEIQEAEDEGVLITNSWGVGKLLGAEAAVEGVELIRCTSVFDREHRFNPTFDPNVYESVPAEAVITAIGLAPNTAPFASELTLNRNGTIQVDPETLATSLACVFAGGDAVTGPSMIVTSIGQGKRAAFHIDRFLRGETSPDVRYDERLPVADRSAVVAQAREGASRREPIALVRTPVAERLTSFAEYRGRAQRSGRPRERQPLPRLRRLLGVPSVRGRLSRERDRPRHEAPPGDRDGRLGGDRDRLLPLRCAPEARLRLRTVPERDHRRADGPHPRADPSVQRRRAPLRRKDAHERRVRALHRIAGRAGRQSPLLSRVLHVLDEAGPAPHGRRPARGRHDLLHRHPSVR